MGGDPGGGALLPEDLAHLDVHISTRGNQAAAAVAVVESWLVSDGRVRGLDLHRWRFQRGCVMRGFGPACRGQPALPVSGRPRRSADGAP